MKPDWKDAPAWANWITCEGTMPVWTWHEKLPYVIGGDWVSDGKQMMAVAAVGAWRIPEPRPEP